MPASSNPSRFENKDLSGLYEELIENRIKPTNKSEMKALLASLEKINNAISKSTQDFAQTAESTTLKELEARKKQLEDQRKTTERLARLLERQLSSEKSNKKEGSSRARDVGEILESVKEIEGHIENLSRIYEMSKYQPEIAANTEDTAVTTRVIAGILGDIAERQDIKLESLDKRFAAARQAVSGQADTAARPVSGSSDVEGRLNYSGMTRQEKELERLQEELAKTQKEIKKLKKDLADEADKDKNKASVKLNEKALDELRKAEAKQTNEIEDLTKKIEEQKKRLEEQEKSREKTRTVINAAVSAISNIVKTVFSWYETSFKNIQQDYLKNFSDITTRLNLTASDYTKVYQDTAREFRDTHLDIQFDTMDYMSKLSANLNLGLRGEIARSKTMSDLITKKLVPSIDTNSRGYLQAYKTYGNKFSQIIVGMERLNNSLGKNAEYFERDIYQQNAEGLTQLFAGMGWSPEQVANFHLAMSDFTNAYGAQAAQELSTKINQALMSGDVMESMAHAGYALPDWLITALQSNPSEAIGNITGKTQDLVSSMNGPNKLLLTNVLSGIGLTPFNADTAAYITQYYNPEALTGTKYQESDFLESYNTNIQKLTDGFFSSETEKMSKRFNNKGVVVNSATTLAEVLPNKIQDLIGVVIAGFAGVITAIIGKKPLEIATDAITNFVTKKGLSFKGIREAVSVGGAGGGSAGGAGGGSAAGGSVSGAGGVAVSTLIGGGLLIGGTLWKAISSVNAGNTAYERAINSGYSEEAARALGLRTGARKAVGVSDYSLHSDDLAYRKENYKYNFGESFESGAQLGLMAGGVGTMIGGPLAGVIAGAVGLLVGGVGNAISQGIQKIPFADFFSSMEIYEKTIENADKALNEYNASIAQTNKLETIANKLYAEENLHTRSNIDLTKITNDDLKYLSNTYPEYFGNLTDVSQLSSGYADILESLIALQKDEYYRKLEEAQKENIKNLDEANKKENYLSSGLGKNTIDSLKTLWENSSYDFSVSDITADTSELQKIATTGGYASIDDMVTALNGGANGDILTKRGDKYVWSQGFAGRSFLGGTLSRADRGIDKLEYNATDTLANKESLITRLQAIASDIKGEITLVENNPNFNLKEHKPTIQEGLKKLKEDYKNLTVDDFSRQDDANKQGLTTLLESYNALFKERYPDEEGLTYRTGIDYVSSDRVATLHAGELVANATDFKALVTSLGENIATMQLTRAELVADNSGVDNVNASLRTKESVDTVAGILQHIYILLSNLNFAPRVASPYSEEQVNFTGGARW